MDQKWKMPAFIREPMAAYQARRNEYLTSHQLVDFTRCPALFKRKRDGLDS
jgi:hypothetical protein